MDNNRTLLLYSCTLHPADFVLFIIVCLFFFQSELGFRFSLQFELGGFLLFLCHCKRILFFVLALIIMFVTTKW